MTQYELIRDSAGAIILPGKVQKTLTWTPGIDGLTSLPSWLTCTSGTATIVQSSASAAGECQLQSTSGGSGTITTTGTYDLSLYEAVYLQVSGLYTTDANLNTYVITINGTNTGGAFHTIAGLSSNVIKQNLNGSTGGSQTVNFNATTSTTWCQCSYDLGFLIMVRTGIAYALQDDQVYGLADYSGGSGSLGTLLTGAVQPTFNTTATSSVQTTAHIKGMKITFAQY